MELEDYRRYGRQMIIDGIGLEGQLKLQRSSVVVVGAGGLGCPALQYLAAAGIGRLGIIDFDVVELSNLQRQILHTEKTVGLFKAISAAEAIKRLNHGIEVVPIMEALLPHNAVSLLQPYDIILDCTDNSPTRYLLSDTAVHLNKPLVSGAAQKFDGQLCIYNLGNTGPCYRCLFPQPPVHEASGTCEETGILGVVTGIIGSMQALEAVKLITGLHDGIAFLTLFSALGSPPFRTVKLRSRKPTCSACGTPESKLGIIQNIDYVAFCGGERPDWESKGMIDKGDGHRITAMRLKEILDSGLKVNIIDVRPQTEFGICSIPESINIPLDNLVANPEHLMSSPMHVQPFYVICRLGNDSQIAANALRDLGCDIEVFDIIGGLKAWTKNVDSTFPIY